MKEKRSLFFNTSLIYFVVITGFVLIRILSNTIKFDAMGANILTLLIQVGFMLLVPFFMYKIMYKKKTNDVLKDFHVKKINIKALLIAILLGVVIYFLNMAVASFFSVIITSTGYDPSFGLASGSGGEYTLVAFIGDLIMSALLPGVCEEFCHRGLLVNGYKQIGAKKTIMLVGLLFGLMHLNVEQFFYATIIGMFLTFLVYLTDSVIPSMIIHFLNNAIGIFFSFAEANKLPFGNISEALGKLFGGDALTSFTIIIFAVVLFVGLLIFLTYMLLKQTRVKDFQKLAMNAIQEKQRSDLLESFDINVNELNAEQGLKQDTSTEVVVGPQFIRNGLPNIRLDVNFDENNLLYNKTKKPSLKDKAFLIGTIVLGVIITISTLIWGIL